MNTNSNSYTIIYSAVLVVIVAFLLAFVSTSLKTKQDANVALDEKKQILASLNIRGIDGQEAEQMYEKTVRSTEKCGDKVYYVCDVNGSKKYVFPLNGMGLWGPISGFISVDDDKNTVYGAYFNHASETAGLGAEIKDNQAWQEQFQGKKIFKDGSNDVALSVCKKVDDPTTQVDAVTGATLTSDGVTNMLHKGLKDFEEVLK